MYFIMVLRVARASKNWVHGPQVPGYGVGKGQEWDGLELRSDEDRKDVKQEGERLVQGQIRVIHKKQFKEVQVFSAIVQDPRHGGVHETADADPMWQYIKSNRLQSANGLRPY